MKVVTVARKPVKGSVAACVVEQGCGALNVDACRIGTTDTIQGGAGGLLSNVRDSRKWGVHAGPDDNGFEQSTLGRWPSNMILQGGAVVADVDEQSGERKSPSTYVRKTDGGRNVGIYSPETREPAGTVTFNYGDKGGASRFFFQVGIE